MRRGRRGHPGTMPEEWILEISAVGGQRRMSVSGRMTIGRSRECDIVLDDPYVSRSHCLIEGQSRGVYIAALSALNGIIVNGHEHVEALLPHGAVFVLGASALRVLSAMCVGEEPTLRLTQSQGPAALMLRASTRELVDCEGTLVAQFSSSEYLAFAALARRHPDAASHYELGQAVWGEIGFDQYQLHRLLQRIRQRLGDAGAILENVRGAGYRVRTPIETA